METTKKAQELEEAARQADARADEAEATGSSPAAVAWIRGTASHYRQAAKATQARAERRTAALRKRSR